MTTRTIPSHGPLQTMRTPTGVYVISALRNAGEFSAALVKASKAKAKKPPADRRAYPNFYAGMSTAEYVQAYEMLNGSSKVGMAFVPGFYDRASLNDEPCALYCGEDTFETVDDDPPAPI